MTATADTATADRAGTIRDTAATVPSGTVREPPTGAEYLESLRDGRVIYFDGKRVDDVTTHPAFTNGAHSVARMYDALHDPERQDTLTFVTERGSRSHKFYKMPTSSQDLFEARDAIAEWARMSYGSLSRGPDYKAALVGGLAMDKDFYGEFADNVQRWYEKVTDDVMFVNLSLLNPIGDRLKSVGEQRDTYMHVVKERDDGIVVRGARMISTGAAFSHVTYVSQYLPASGFGVDEKDFCLGFFLPFDAPGVKFIGRYSYEYMAKKLGTPFDYPLSSRFDESDYSIVLDDVFIPWENVTVYRNPEVVNALLPRDFAARFMLHAATRTAVKLDFLCGLLMQATDMNQISNFRGVQGSIGEVLGLRHQIWALSTAMCAEPDPAPGGPPYVHPNMSYALQWRNCYGDILNRIRTIFHNLMAGGFIQIPSSAQDFQNPTIRYWLDRYWKTATLSAETRIKLMRLIWEEFATEFAGRAEVHDRSFAGSYEANRLETYFTAQGTGLKDQLTGMVDKCMSEYDLNGFTTNEWPQWQQLNGASST